MRILIVDDLVANRVLLSEIISLTGFESVCVRNGKEAIDILLNQHFDVVLMDIEMPVMNGFETTKYIRNKMSEPLSKIPILAITAHDPNMFFEEYKDVGFNNLVTKPYTVEKIKNLMLSLKPVV
jgi:two-component system, response regulator, stage 0 sporulation protein F